MAKPKRPDPAETLLQVHNYGVNLHTREVYLHSFLGAGEDEPGVEYRMATTFIKNLHVLESQGRQGILVHMHTVGGEWCDGMAIYDAIRACRCPVTILAHAQASSMSGIIFQAARRRALMPSCEFLVHYGSLSVDGDSLAAKSLIEWNDTLHQEMLRIYSERAVDGEFFKRSGMNARQAEEYMDKQIRQASDWFFGAEEAVSYGLADGILGREWKTIEALRK